ncbi:MAG: NIPSNAP family protein [Dehalococcoidia bacterium]|nr:NIPSNAP family protein [Dehalococcoidia bacterium]
MIYELRVYEAMPGKLPALNQRFAGFTSGAFKKYGIKEIGYWTTVIGRSNTLTYLLAYENLAAREKAWTAFQSDPERDKVFAESEKDGSLVKAVHSSILQPTAYSPLK